MRNITKEVAQQIIDMVNPLNESAALCLEDAEKCMAHGRYDYAAGRALHAISHVSGVCSDTYQRACELCETCF